MQRNNKRGYKLPDLNLVSPVYTTIEVWSYELYTRMLLNTQTHTHTHTHMYTVYTHIDTHLVYCIIYIVYVQLLLASSTLCFQGFF